VREGGEEALLLALDEGALRFAPVGDAAEGLAVLDLREARPGVLRERAETAGLWRSGGTGAPGSATVGGVALRPAAAAP